MLATCLGCGCTCDDVTVVAEGGRVTGVQTDCGRARTWFQAGQQPRTVRVDGRPASIDEALHAVAVRLRSASQPLIVIGADVSCETQRAAVALADATRARLDTLTGARATASVAAGQQYGRVSATLGEFRHRADLVIFWGVDPGDRFPRLRSRYLADPDRVGRTLVAVDIGGRRGPDDCARRVAVEPQDELATLTTWADALRDRSRRTSTGPAAELGSLARVHGYVAVVVDGESGNETSAYLAAGALADVARALHDVTRGGVCTLRDGGNRSGADAVLTWQTGFPARVDFSAGYPRQDLSATGAADVTLLIGRDERHMGGVEPELLAIGPGASMTSARVAIDTGTAGIHEGGLAYRLDDVPVPLRALVPGAPTAAELVRRTVDQVAEVRSGR